MRYFKLLEGSAVHYEGSVLVKPGEVVSSETDLSRFKNKFVEVDEPVKKLKLSRKPAPVEEEEVDEPDETVAEVEETEVEEEADDEETGDEEVAEVKKSKKKSKKSKHK